MHTALALVLPTFCLISLKTRPITAPFCSDARPLSNTPSSQRWSSPSTRASISLTNRGWEPFSRSFCAEAMPEAFSGTVKFVRFQFNTLSRMALDFEAQQAEQGTYSREERGGEDGKSPFVSTRTSLHTYSSQVGTMYFWFAYIILLSVCVVWANGIIVGNLYLKIGVLESEANKREGGVGE